MKLLILTATLFTASLAAKAARNDYTTPVPILKQIDKHNEDGSYSYGYEAADGTFKIETKYPDGEVYGKYGYVDDTGALREVEYGASRRGFEPTGSEIQVAPPTLKSKQNAVVRPLAADEEDDGQYREDPGIYYEDDPYASQPRAEPASRYQPQSYYAEPAYEPEPIPEYKPRTSYKPQSYYAPKSIYKPSSYYSRQEPEYAPEPEYRPQPVYRPQTEYRPEPVYTPKTSYRPQSYYNPPVTPAPWRPQANYGFNNNNNYAPTHHYPQTYNAGYGNVDWQSGSYSVNYKR